MTICIVLTAEQADAVRGEVSPGYAIEPVQMLDGQYAINASVLTIAGYASAWPLLQALPQRGVTAADFPQADDAA